MSDVPDLSSDEEQFNEEEWHEMDTSSEPVTCLFCSHNTSLIEDAIYHCNKKHNFCLISLKQKFNMDCYSYIKMINYIKTHKPNPEDIVSSSTVLWNDDKYLKPVETDDWLLYDFESIADQQCSPQSYHANVENGVVTLSQAHFLELQRTIQTLTGELKESQSLLQMAREDIVKMQSSMKTIVDGGHSGDNGNDEVNCVAKVPIESDEGYFNSYSHFGIHYEMLSDKVRTQSYREAILLNTDVFKDKIVLDLGCGTGILSMFSATAGAKRVYALDQSDIIYQAMDIIRENNLQEVIKPIKGRLENTKLMEKVDIIVSEWMGYFLLFEGMLDSVIYARDNCLNPGGLLLPNRCNISLVANGDVEAHQRYIDFWSDVYDYKMNCMKSVVVKEATIDIVNASNLISEPYIIKEIDINTCSTDVVNFNSAFSLVITKDGKLTSIVGYFDTFFDLPNNISFSTGPHTTHTHWKQTIFYFKDCKPVKKGDVIDGKIVCSRQKSDVRALTVQICIFGKVHEYVLSAI